MAKSTNNALRFINAYNQIEQALKAQNNFRNSMSYTEAVRLASRNNSIVRKYEDTLTDYGRLRNAIVHSVSDNQVIAEPLDEVVVEYEKLAKLISTPPLAINTVCRKDVKCVDASVSLSEVLVMMYKLGFSNFPVYHKGMLVGVANANKISRFLGEKIYCKQHIEELMGMPIGEVVKNTPQENFYTLVDSKITLDKVLNLFAENRKLNLIIITPNGTLLEPPIGIIVVGDIVDINNILDNYE